MAEILTANQEEKNEQKEDYALQRVPKHSRLRWPGLMNVAVGIATAMLFMQMGSLMAVQFGSVNALLAELYATLVTGFLGVTIAYFAAKNGLNVNLMSRGAGFGFIGASITSFIYAINFIMYCAIEGSIMALAVHEYMKALPIWALMIFFGLAVIPLNWYGVKQLQMFQKYSLPLYLVLLCAGIYITTTKEFPNADRWLTFLPEGVHVGGIGLITCIGIMNGLVGIMALLISDYARFIKQEEFKIGVFAVGFIPQLICFFLSGVLGIWFGVRYMADNPGVYFVTAMGVWGALFAILTQLRINVTNLYSGSMSLANFFARVFHFTPGRVFWVVTTAVLAIGCMLFGILDYIGPMLTFQGVFLFAWGSILVTDMIIIKKWLKLGQLHVEHRRGFLPEWNPVGVVSVVIASAVGTVLASGSYGPVLAGFAALLAGVLASAISIIIAVVTKGKTYFTGRIAENPSTAAHPNKYGESVHTCGTCAGEFISEDMLYCPFHTGNICSQCCAAESHCHAVCKSESVSTEITA
ncbi:purine-cytosine permease-like protein [Aneurinibacillus soli]|uniref:Cytosine permease n=1 Tax=Aneurinibacillus soli TaxID=1500254 RepID=A0A0U5AS66_9BACL|nr:cytosine permease [Aneurinibacillus soli]PYE58792.1 purine-cytosine permease-like protein [Aneurinibacillus soli]BAU26657.1 cytosine permease [Aneurinibacillus soli]